MTLRSRLLALTVLGLAATTAAPLPPAAADEPPTIDVRPASLDRGADPQVPHVVGQEVVDGDIRLPVRGRTLELLGGSDGQYVVSVSRRHGWRTLRVDLHGNELVLARGRDSYPQALSADTTRLAVQRTRPRRTVIAVIDADVGRRLARRELKGYRHLLDVDRTQVLLGSFNRGRTLSWRFDGARVRTVVGRTGYEASLAEDRLATYTADPYDGGCTVVSRISDPGTRLWRSCEDRVESFAPGARRMSTIALLSDGVGPNRMTVRRPRGAVVADYVAPRGWLAPVRWESPTVALSLVHGPVNQALVRLDGAASDRASDLSPSPGARQAG